MIDTAGGPPPQGAAPGGRPGLQRRAHPTRRHRAVRYDAVASVRPRAPRGRARWVTELVAPTATLAGALGALAGSRRANRRPSSGGTALQGEVRAVGADVVTLRLDDRSAAYVPLTSLGELSVVESG